MIGNISLFVGQSFYFFPPPYSDCRDFDRSGWHSSGREMALAIHPLLVHVYNANELQEATKFDLEIELKESVYLLILQVSQCLSYSIFCFFLMGG